MKTNFLFILLLSISGTIKSQVVKEGNIARYYFNNGNANDEIGENDGVIYGAVLSDDRFENIEHAYSFNNSYIRIDHDNELDLGAGSFSISAWFKTANKNTYGVIINKGEGTTIKPRIFIRTMETPSSTLQWRVGDGINNVTVSHTDSSYFDNEWHHVVLVRQNSSISLYLDGVLIDETIDSQLPTINTNSARPILLGVQDSVYSSSGNLGFANYFDGSLDDYRIYNRSITDLEVDSLYNEGNPMMTSGVEIGNTYKGLKVYPNPTKEYISLVGATEITIDEYEIVNTQGKQLKRETLRGNEINVRRLANGLYILKFYRCQELIGLERFIKN